MPLAETRWIKRLAEFRPKAEVDLVPRRTRGIYVMFRHRPKADRYDVVYVGLSTTGVAGRLQSHTRSARKGQLWSHFSVFEVWDNVSDAEIGELEGLFRHVYRHDSRANRLNVQRTYKPFQRVREDDLRLWSR